MENKFGKKINKWNWKTLHTIEFTHFLGRQFPLNYLFNIGPYGVGGGYSQINNMKHKHEILDYSVYAGPSTRRLVDFAEPEKSWGILPTGNSGNVLSAHYRDQTDLFLKGKYRRQWLNKDDITKNDFKLMRFLPERGNNEDHL